MEDALNFYEKARRMMAESKFEDAIALFQKSISSNPHFKTLELLGECYFHLNRLAEAIVPLAAAVSLNKGVRAASLLSEVFLKLEDYPAAKNMSEIALGRDSSNSKARQVKKTVDEILEQK